MYRSSKTTLRFLNDYVKSLHNCPFTDIKSSRHIAINNNAGRTSMPENQICKLHKVLIAENLINMLKIKYIYIPLPSICSLVGMRTIDEVVSQDTSTMKAITTS